MYKHIRRQKATQNTLHI